jgi:hypothetical protein
MYQNRRSTYAGFILLFVAIKVMLNLAAMSHFGFQRDELLHLALGDHLAWGYKEVPPFVAVIAKISTTLFGGSVFATRIFSTIFGALIIWFTGMITVELGGKKFAIMLACLAMIFAPAFAASDYLFQPVVFDQFWWVFTVWLIIKYINTSHIKYLYFLGIAIGLGLLTKYTMAFFAIALLLGLLFTKQRRLLLSWHVAAAVLIALILFLPNIIWQFQHHLPVVTHMKTLQSTQLDYITPAEFISQQLMVNGFALFVWLTGFFFLIFSFKLRKYQFLAFAYILIFIFLLEMNGKNYYIFGAYPMLFAAGGFGFERWLKNSGYALRGCVIAIAVVPNLLLFPMLLPILPLNQTLQVFKVVREKIPAFDFVVTWEDLKKHATTQDYADMLGWDELTQKVAATYHSLSPEQQRHTVIVADNYGEAGAIHHYGKQYNLPDVISHDSSFALWSPPDVADAQYVIFIDDNDGDNTKRFIPMTDSIRYTGSIVNPLAREKGTGIYLLIHPKPVLNTFFKKDLAEKLAE